MYEINKKRKREFDDNGDNDRPKKKLNYNLFIIKIFIINAYSSYNNICCYLCFVKLISYAIILPSLPKYKDKLSERGKTHYNNVVDSRRWKGLLAISLGLLIGILLYNAQNHDIHKTQKWANIIFVTFWSMFVFYEIMWQNKFLFEDSNLDEMIDDDGKLGAKDVEDLRVYADKYRDMHLAENIINIVTFFICIVVTTSFYFYLKKH